MTHSVLIVGGSVAGVAVAVELREGGFAGTIELIDSQNHLPYDRPPLSKSFLTETLSMEAVHFHPASQYDKLAVDLVLGERAVHLDSAARAVRLGSGKVLRADAVVITTGARARPFPPAKTVVPIWTVREAPEAIALRQALGQVQCIAVVGGGFIGAEIASSARKLGVEVTIFEADTLPFQRIVGPEVARRLARLHEEAGVTLECGAAIERVRSANGRPVVEVSDGREMEVDLVIAGIGSLPNVEWLEGSGLRIEGGIACDKFGRTSAPGVFAAGDVAAWYDPLLSCYKRHEHWTSAKQQGRIIAQHVLGVEPSTWSKFVPYFWSDIHGKRFQVLGEAGVGSETHFVYEDPARGAFVAEYRREGSLIGVAGCNAAAKTMRYLAQLTPA